MLTRRNKVIGMIICIVIVILAGWAIHYGMSGDVEKPAPIVVVDPITASNQQIDAKEHQKADNKKKYADAEKIIQEQKAIQAQAQSGNAQLDIEISALQQTKEDAISGK